MIMRYVLFFAGVALMGAGAWLLYRRARRG
jgi:LPXTG-motif cell wall-anchored protein